MSLPDALSASGREERNIPHCGDVAMQCVLQDLQSHNNKEDNE